MAKRKQTNQGTPPKNGIPPEWQVNGTTFKVVATDIESDVVTVKDHNGRTYFFNFYKLRERLNQINITS